MTSKPRELFLIDAFAHIFRAYHAIRGGMRSPVTSEPTHAVFGFTAMLLKLLEQHHPEFIAVAADSPGKTFRDELYADYKATRRVTPHDLTAQIARVWELIELFGIPVLSHEGMEADDVIASITRTVLDDPADRDVQIRIASRDKDLEQLLGDRVTMVDVYTDKAYDVAALYEAKGVRPEQVIDLLTLTGDSTDNVPGVPGVGIKTAAQLLQEYATIEGIFQNIEGIKGKLRENLEGAREQIPVSRRLVTLRCDTSAGFSLEAARMRPIQAAKLQHLFQQLGFHRFQEDVRRLAADGREAADAGVQPPQAAGTAESPASPKEAQARGAYRAIMTLAELEELAQTLQKHKTISVDTETSGLERDARLCGISFAWTEREAVYVPLLSPEPDRHLRADAALPVLKPLLEDWDLAKCGHNLKFDARVLLRAGIQLRGVRFDSMLACLLIDPGKGSAKLDHVAKAELGYSMIPITELIGEGPDQTAMDAVPLKQIVPYAAEDADIALRLATRLAPRLEEIGMAALMRDVEAPLTTVLAQMEANGILVDPDELLKQGEQLSGRVEELKAEVRDAAGFDFDLNSPKQLAEALFDKLGLKTVKRTKTGRSTDIEVLEKLAAEEDRNNRRTSVPRLIMEYRQLTKLISTYLYNLRRDIDPDTRRIHTTYHQLVTATGRLASQNPNLQNIPVRTDIGRRIRAAFMAPRGSSLISADYSQVELRILAHLSADPALIDAFEKGLDIHKAVAAEVFGVTLDEVTRQQRDQAKTINFGIIYGVTPYGLARRIEGMDLESATRLITEYKKRYAGIDRFLQECISKAQSDGYVSTIMGRRREIREIHSRNVQERSLGERLAINSVVQGSAADLIKQAMVNAQRRIDREALPLRMLLQIHDELVFETPEPKARDMARIVRHEMEHAMTLRVPLVVETGIGPSWLEAK